MRENQSAPIPGTFWASGSNRLFYGFALIWIVGSMLISMRLFPIEAGGREYHDFSQFYMGGVIARHGAWDALYPLPRAESMNNPGEAADSDMRPAYAALAAQSGVPADKTRFIQSPPVALLLEPISSLGYRNAKRVWNLLMALCAWGVAVFAGRTYEYALGTKSRVAGWIAIAVAISPLTLETLRLMNVTPFIALMIGCSVFGLVRRNDSGALALVIGAVTKYATLALLPLYLVARRWRAILVMAGAGIAIMAASIAVMGFGPFRVFLSDMLPTFARPHLFPWNRSIYALMMRLQSGVQDERLQPLRGAMPAIVQSLRWLTFLGIAVVLLTRTNAVWQQPRMLFAASAVLLAWFLAFSPILWDHYLFYLVPFWGWLLYEARGSRLKALLVGAIILFQSMPGFLLDSQIAIRLHLRGPYDVFPLVTVTMIGIFGLERLLRTLNPTPRQETAFVAR